MNRRRFLQTAGAGAGLGLVAGKSQGFHNGNFGISPISGHPYVQPTYGDIANLQILGHSDMGFGDAGRTNNWDQTYEFRVLDTPRGRFAYCSNGANGWSIVDVTHPRKMETVWRQPHSTLPDNTQYLDIKEGGIMVPKRNQKLECWDVNDPSNPKLLGSYTPPDIGNRSYHGLWIHEGTNQYRGRRFAFMACGINGFTDMILLIHEITDPTNPHEVARWWYPGMGPGETPTWPTDGSITVQCHDMTVYNDRCYAAWRDKGLQILDISDITKPRRVGEINWADGRPNFPSLPGQTHSFGLIPSADGGPIDTLIAMDELGVCPFGFMHFLDVSDETLPREISNFMVPLNMHGNCPADRSGRRMGTHDVERNHFPHNIAWSAWEEGGYWGVDFSDIHNPKWAGYFVPPVRSDSPAASRSGHADDVFVMADGTIYGSSSDRGAGGLTAMRYRPGIRGKVTWNAEENNFIQTNTETRARYTGD